VTSRVANLPAGRPIPDRRQGVHRVGGRQGTERARMQTSAGAVRAPGWASSRPRFDLQRSAQSWRTPVPRSGGDSGLGLSQVSHDRSSRLLGKGLSVDCLTAPTHMGGAIAEPSHQPHGLGPQRCRCLSASVEAAHNFCSSTALTCTLLSRVDWPLAAGRCSGSPIPVRRPCRATDSRTQVGSAGLRPPGVCLRSAATHHRRSAGSTDRCLPALPGR
jgi:hypothetical protein